MTPQELALDLEQNARLPAGNLDRFNGYGGMGLPFASGHVLAFRRFPASSIGPGYISVWHRSPAGNWTFYSDIEPATSCSRFFGKLVKESILIPIRFEWTGPYQFQITILEIDFTWNMTVGSTFASNMLNTIGKMLPISLWQNQTVLKIMSVVAGPLLGAGKVSLFGITPNGQHFMVNPSTIWLIKESKAILRGKDLGPIGPLPKQTHLAGFYVPQKGILAFGQAYFI